MMCLFFTWTGDGTKFSLIFNKIDSFHNFRYIQSVPEPSRKSEREKERESILLPGWTLLWLWCWDKKKQGWDDDKDEEVRMPEFLNGVCKR